MRSLKGYHGTGKRSFVQKTRFSSQFVSKTTLQTKTLGVFNAYKADGNHNSFEKRQRQRYESPTHRHSQSPNSSKELTFVFQNRTFRWVQETVWAEFRESTLCYKVSTLAERVGGKSLHKTHNKPSPRFRSVKTRITKTSGSCSCHVV